MKSINNKREFLKMFNKEGYPLEPFIVKRNSLFINLNGITSLKNVKLEERVELYDLIDLESLEGVELGENVRLTSLTKITNLDNVKLKKGIILEGLDNTIVKPINPTDVEIAILKKIPLDGLKMSSWHCGTSHCLAGWAQVLSGIEENDDNAFADGCRLLPSMQAYFFCKDEQVKEYLKTLH